MNDRGSRGKPGARPGGAQRADDELPLDADVEQSALETQRKRETEEDVRRRRDEGLAQPARLGERPADQAAVGLDHHAEAAARDQDDERAAEQRQRQGQPGLAEPRAAPAATCRRRARLAALAAGAISPPAISRPTCSRVASRRRAVRRCARGTSRRCGRRARAPRPDPPRRAAPPRPGRAPRRCAGG